MRWLKHMTATRDDEKVARLVAKLGHEGYGLWWMILETVAGSIENGSGRYSLSYPCSKWAASLQLHPPNVRRQLAAIAAEGLLELRCNGAEIEVIIPNLLKYRDEYSRKSGHSPDNVRSKQQKQKQIQNTEAEAEQSAAALLDKHVPRIVQNPFGRPETNPARLKIEETLHKARSRIETAENPAAYELRIVTDELRTMGVL